ncbi:MAG TPA: hypothetical protein VGR90_10840, partial [Acidimicrobiales bacterium]|nr:hypothetical protein [Acidimicrobiales bacterium]
MSGARMLAGALLAGAIVLAACGGNPAATRSGRTARPSTSTTSTTSPPSTTTTTTAPVADTFPVAPLAWTGCGSLQCASLPVPLDYADPGGARITVAVARQPARVPSQRIGSLVINPGGPGGSGIDDLPTELRVLTSTLQDRFDIV